MRVTPLPFTPHHYFRGSGRRAPMRPRFDRQQSSFNPCPGFDDAGPHPGERFMTTQMNTTDHEWINIEDHEAATVGITHHAQDALAMSFFRHLPAVSKTWN